MKRLQAGFRAQALAWAAVLLGAFSLQAKEEDERAIGVVAVANKQAIIPDAKHNWGVFIGVNTFKAEGVAPLRFCVRDARALHDALTGPDKLIPPEQSYLLTSDQPDKDAPTRVNILKTIQYVCNSASQDSLILVSVSTHGFTDTKGDGGAYVLPVDGDPELLAHTAVSVKAINDFLTNAKATKRLLFVDACREDTARGEKGAAAAAMSDKFQEELRGAKGQVTLASCDQSQVSYEDPTRGHGVFTYYLLQGLTGQAPPNHKGFITVDTLFSFAADATREWCRANRKNLQEPWKYAAMSGDIPLAIPTGQAYVPPPITTPISPTPLPAPVAAAPRGTPAQASKPVPTAPLIRYKLDPSKNFEADLGGGQKIEMIHLPGGTFTMGSTLEIGELSRTFGGSAKDYDSEQPAHQVTLDPFWIGKCEVTNAQYRTFDKRHTSGIHRTTKEDLNTDAKPVVNVGWPEAKKFTAWLSGKTGKRYDLPTEAQWEYAARGGVPSEFYWGNDMEKAAQYENFLDQAAAAVVPRWTNALPFNDKFISTAPVGSFQPNPFGLYDMLGNAAEMCRDAYNPTFYKKEDANKNPYNTLTFGRSKDMVARGGSWYAYRPFYMRLSYRGKASPRVGEETVGFRIVLEE